MKFINSISNQYIIYLKYQKIFDIIPRKKNRFKKKYIKHKINK